MYLQEATAKQLCFSWSFELWKQLRGKFSKPRIWNQRLSGQNFRNSLKISSWAKQHFRKYQERLLLWCLCVLPISGFQLSALLTDHAAHRHTSYLTSFYPTKFLGLRILCQQVHTNLPFDKTLSKYENIFASLIDFVPPPIVKNMSYAATTSPVSKACSVLNAHRKERNCLQFSKF